MGRNRQKGSWHIKPHSHPVCEVVVLNYGAEDVSFDGAAARTFHPGDVLAFHPGMVHEEWLASGHGSLDTFFFILPCEGPLSIPAVLKDSDGRLRVLCSWIWSQQFDRDELSQRQLDSMMSILSMEMQRLAERSEGSLAAALRKAVGESLDADWSLDALAKAAGLSKFHFLRKYREETGSTPMEEVARMRVYAARSLLLAGRLSLKEIASACGLGDAAGLSRSFKRAFGCTPGSLRRG